MTWMDLFYMSPLLMVGIFALVVMIWTIIDIRKPKRRVRSH